MENLQNPRATLQHIAMQRFKSQVSWLCICVTKLSVHLGHDNLILTRAVTKAVLILSYKSLRRRRERSHTVNVQHNMWLL